MNDEAQAGAPEAELAEEQAQAAQAAVQQQAKAAGGVPAPEPITLVDGPVITGVEAWAASLMTLAPDVTAENASTWVANCLRDGYEQGASAALLAAPGPAPHQESIFHRIEDDVMKAAEEAAYAVSNLTASARGRKPDDSLDAWRQRTGGLWRHHHAA